MPAKIEIVPFKDGDGNIVIYDMFVDGTWIGSRRTPEQCEDDLKEYRNDSHSAVDSGSG